MFAKKWSSKFNRLIAGRPRLRIFLLNFIAISPGILLVIYLIVMKQKHEALVVFICDVFAAIAVWYVGDFPIERSVTPPLDLSERYPSGDLNGRSDPTDLAQCLDRAATLGEALSEIIDEITVQHDLVTTLQFIVDKVKTLLNAPVAAISLYDVTRSDFEIVAVSGLDLPSGKRIRIGEGAAGFAAETRQPFIVDRYDLWEDRLPEFESFGLTSVMQVPIMHRNELIGVLGIAEVGEMRKFTQVEIRLVKLIAGVTASAIKNARLFEEAQLRLRELEAINTVSRALRGAQSLNEMLPILLEKTMRSVNAVTGCIWLYDTLEDCLYPIVSNGIVPPITGIKPGKGINFIV
jgi:hypothetical protein